MTLLSRWLRFSAGGFYGFLLQLVVLTVLSRHMRIGLAAAIAVESALLHNFIWHELITWRERHVLSTRAILKRALKFQMTNGSISLAGNVVVTTFAVSEWHIPAALANVIAVLACAALNFAASEWLVFARKARMHPEDREILFV